VGAPHGYNRSYAYICIFLPVVAEVRSVRGGRSWTFTSFDVSPVYILLIDEAIFGEGDDSFPREWKAVSGRKKYW
jgi:hypothetical protein